MDGKRLPFPAKFFQYYFNFGSPFLTKFFVFRWQRKSSKYVGQRNIITAY